MDKLIRLKNKALSIYPYVKLQTKLSFTPNRIEKTARKVMRYVLDVIVFAIVLFFVHYLLRSLVTQSTLIPAKSISILIFTIGQLALLIISIINQCKRLHKPEDLRIISSFPLTSFQRYVGEIIAIYIKLFVYALVIFFPLMIVYGLAGKIMSVGFVFSSLLATILLPLIPFAISLIVSVPFMFLGRKLQNKNIAKLVLFVVVFIGILVVYSLVLRFMADWFIHAKNNVEVIEGIASVLSKLNGPYNVAFYTSEIAIANNIGANFGWLMLITICCTAIGICITKPLYYRFTSSASALEGNAKVIKAKLTQHSPYQTIFLKEMKQILRTPNYAYFYFGVAFSMPIMTYLVADLVKMLGESSTGSHIFYGFGILILFIIMSLIGSFSANSISREGPQFYITKVAPLSYRKQLIAKALVNFVITFVALTLCVIALAVTVNFSGDKEMGLSVMDLILIFFTMLFFLVGITFNGINLNLARPKITMTNTAPNESNVVIQLLIGIAITFLLTGTAIIVDGVIGKSSIYCHVTIMGIMLIYALINFIVFFFTAEKKYARIEAK